MGTFTYDCIECGKTDSAEIDSKRGQAEVCYGCYVKGISFSFRGVRGGRESFHEDTTRSVVKETVDAAAAQGRTVRPKSKVGGTAFTAPSKKVS